jgi:hypothetical protein
MFALVEEYNDKEAFKPFEQNIKKVTNIGTYGAVYSAAIQLDRNQENRHLELIESLREVIQQVREEIHTVRIELNDAKMDLANIAVSALLIYKIFLF